MSAARRRHACPKCGREVTPSKRNSIIPNHYGRLVEGEVRKPTDLCSGGGKQIP